MSVRRVKKRSELSPDLPVWPEQVVGSKYVRFLERHLHQLRDEVPHGNQRLFLDDVLVAYLLAFFNPTIRSLRTLEDFSQTVQVQKHVSIPKLCRSTLSDFNQLADPSRLEPLLSALRRQLNRRHAQRGTTDELATLLRSTVAVDGTFLPAAADVAWALRCSNQRQFTCHRARVDVHLGVENWWPEVIAVPPAGQSESDSAITHVQPGRVYLYDRGFNSFALINAHYGQNQDELETLAHFVARYRPAGGNAPELLEAKAQSLTVADRAAGVISDRLGRFRSSKHTRHTILDVPLREVLIEYVDQGQIKILRLITNLREVPAAVIAHLYRYRWQIELFFRWLKCFGNFDHLISHCRNGVLTHFYVTVIAVLLMYLHTGYRPSKYLFVLMSQVAAGGATIDEVLPILRERGRQNELARQSAARRYAKKKQQG